MKVYYYNFIIIELLKVSDKEKNLKISQRKRHMIYQGIKIRMTTDFPLERIQVRDSGTTIFIVQNVKKQNKTKSINLEFHIISSENLSKNNDKVLFTK